MPRAVSRLCHLALLLPSSLGPTSSLLFLSLIAFPSRNYSSGGDAAAAAAYVRGEAASAKQLSNALGRRLPMAGQVQEKPPFLFFPLFIEC